MTFGNCASSSLSLSELHYLSKMYLVFICITGLIIFYTFVLKQWFSNTGCWALSSEVLI